jgi:hypothetical protein
VTITTMGVQAQRPHQRGARLEGAVERTLNTRPPEVDHSVASPAIPQNTPVDPSPRGQSPSLRGALELVGLVVAPATLLTALALYFGWVLTDARASYFGIDASTLGFSAQDYLLRSADALFVPVGAVVVLGLAVVWLHTEAMRQLTDHSRRTRLRIAARAAVVVGGVLFALGVGAVFEPLSFSPYYLFPPASPGIGIALLAYGLHVLGRIAAEERPGIASLTDARSRVTIMALIALLIVLSSFWTASMYASALGRGRAAGAAATLNTRPLVTVFAPKRLDITGIGVVERLLTGENLAYHYRYSGLRLLIRSGGKYFLLPNGWTRSRGTAIVLDDSPAYRFEFGVGR